jgi:hypothetical protein
MPVCPAGHSSATADYCDTCGALMSGSYAAAPSAPADPALPPQPAEPAAPAEPCPVCAVPRAGRFCEECGHDFDLGTGGAAPLTGLPAATSFGASAPERPQPPESPDPASMPANPPSDAQTPDPQTADAEDPAAETFAAETAWVATVTADRDYYEAVTSVDDLIIFPPYCPERHYPLDGTEVRIGRRSATTGERPEVDLSGPPHDPGISHLHAVLIAEPDGTWQLVDPGSTNGTMLNDEADPIPVNVAVPLKDGDRIHVGAWTTITMRRQQ